MKLRCRLRIVIVCSCVLLCFILFGLGKYDITINYPEFVLHLKSMKSPHTRSKKVNVRLLDGSFQSNFAIVDTVSLSIPMDNNASFVLIFPRDVTKAGNFTSLFRESDMHSAMVAGSLLNTLTHLDGLSCLPSTAQEQLSQHQSWSEINRLYNRSWCNFKKKDWSIQIRNSGKLNETFPLEFIDEPSHRSINMFQICNIVNGPFVIRKDKFMSMASLKRDLGRLTLLDFFVRSGGELKIGKSADCFFNDDLFHHDRGTLNGEGDFPEYSNFGVAHNVLRIVMEDRIEWTKCVATDRLCPEKPYTGPPTTLPRIAQPICCSVVLDRILKDAVSVFDQLGIKYRVAFGTLLGGERSGSIIPYSYDIDFALESKYGDNQNRYSSLQKYFGDKYFISGHSFIDFPRLIPLMPAYWNIDTTSFFKDEYDLDGEQLFSKAINASVDPFLPFSPTDWRSRSYADFYKSPKKYWNGSSTTIINGKTYITAKDKQLELIRYYGNGWKTPVLKTFNKLSDEAQAPADQIKL